MSMSCGQVVGYDPRSPSNTLGQLRSLSATVTTCIAAAPSEHRVFHTLWGLQLPVTEVVLQTLKNLRLTFCSRVSVKCPSCLREGPYSCTAHTTSPEAKIIRDNKDTSVANDSEKLTASSQIVTGISPGSIRWTQFVSKQHFPRSTKGLSIKKCFRECGGGMLGMHGYCSCGFPQPTNAMDMPRLQNWTKHAWSLPKPNTLTECSFAFSPSW